MNSIQRRLGVGLALVLLVFGTLMINGSIWLLDLGLRRHMQNELRDAAEMLLIAVVRGPNGLALDEQRLAPAYHRPLSGSYFRIDRAERVWRSRSVWDFDLPMPEVPGMASGFQPGPGEQQLLVYRANFQRFGETLSVTVAQDYRPLSLAFAQVRWLLSGLGVLAMAIVLFLQWLTLRRAFEPLERTRQQVLQLQQGRRARLDAPVDRELEPLVAQINALLLHTQEHLLRSRNALGNLGHALKTPLAVLRSLLDRPELDALPEWRQGMREQLENIEHRLARALNRARLAGEVLPGAHFDCDRELPALCETLQKVHPQLAELSWQVPAGLRLPYDREDLLEVLGNLLDNACKWARRRVQLRIEALPGAVRVTVEDDGPGVPEAQREQLLTRGVRLDEQVAGHGLGLAIARDTLQAWGADLQLGESKLGGLQVSFRLPV